MAPYSLRRLALARQWLAEHFNNWARDERLATLLVKWFPERKFGYRKLIETYIRNNETASAIDLLLGAPKNIRGATSIVFLLEKALRNAGDHTGARSLLERAQADHPSKPKILIRLSVLYRDDAQFERAHALLLAAESLGRDEPGRRIVIETKAKKIAAGRESLRKLMNKRGRSLLHAAPAVNNFAHCYPDLATEVAQFQAMVRDAVHREEGALSPSDRLELASSCRLIEEARLVHEDAVKRRLPLLGRAMRRYEIARKQSESVSLLARLAWKNELGDGQSLAGLANGRATTIDRGACDPDRTVEVFVPGAFYAPGEPAFKREVFHVLADRILQRRDIIVVPRHQFNWRVCRSMLFGRILSYHTTGMADRRHLRFKEGALPGYITLDHAGYSGFASIATNFDDIRRTTANVSRDALHENRALLYSELVEKGRSKYPQLGAAANIDGRYVFVAMQKLTDTVAELAWMSSIELMREVARLYAGTNIAVVVKKHPLCKSFSVQAAMAELESKGLITVSSASIHSLISRAEVVFTVNSGVGLEALIHGRPVIASGLCDYAYAAACVRNAEELAAAIADLPQQDMKGLEFLYYYTHRHAFKASEIGRLEGRVDEWLDQPLSSDRPLLEADVRSGIATDAHDHALT